jgi:dihydrodipicolinate synthase/N-acetylneuraminate lyase
VAEVGAERPVIKVAGICGPTELAVAEAELAASLGYDLGLLSPGGLAGWSEEALLERARAVAAVLPVFGFYLQPAAGGRRLGYAFWRDFVEIPAVLAIKIAPFDRYATLDVVRAVCQSGRRDEIALYTGNDDNIVADLATPFRLDAGGGRRIEKTIVGGLLGQWAVWTAQAVALLEEVKRARAAGTLSPELLARGSMLTEANTAIFDVAHGFRGCIAGVHEVLRRQGLLEGTWCLDPDETLSPGQQEEIERVCRAYPELTDDSFVAAHLDGWLA